MTSVREAVLEYAVPVRRRTRWWAWTVITAIFILGTGEALPLVIREIQLWQEARRLLTVNAPAARFSTCALTFTPSGLVVLPDGRQAKIAEIELGNSAACQALVAAESASVIQRLWTTEAGYTVVGTDVSGMPIVQVWVLSRRNYNGGCGLDSYAVKRQRGMYLWRNLGMVLVDRNAFPPSPAAYSSSISVLGR